MHASLLCHMLSCDFTLQMRKVQQSQLLSETPSLCTPLTGAYKLLWYCHCRQHLQLLESLVYALPRSGGIEPASTMYTIQEQILLLRRDIRSLRDLTTDCLPLLKNLKHQTCQVWYGVAAKHRGICAHSLQVFDAGKADCR